MSLNKYIRKTLLLTGVFIFFITCNHVSHVDLHLKKLPEAYVAYYTSTPIVIDGLSQEVAWDNAIWSSEFTDIEGIKTPKYNTKFKALWDHDHMYVLARLYDPHLWGNLRQRDTIIFYNNDFEIFIDPDGDTHDYMEIEVNVLNTVWDLFLDKPYRNQGKANSNWNIPGLKTAVSTLGTINNDDDVDQYWDLEIAIPWKDLNEINSLSYIPVNDHWRMNFSRVHWDHDIVNGMYKRKKDSLNNFFPEYNWVWSAQDKINMHLPEKWGYVFFSAMTSANKKEFKYPKDAEFIQWMYCHYRYWLATENNENGTSICPKSYHKKTNIELITDENEGYLYSKSPITNKPYRINAEGKLIPLSD